MDNSFFHHLDVFLLTIIYQYYIPHGKVGHVVKGIPLSRVKDRLNLVRGSLVECPLVSNLFQETTIFDLKNRCTGVFN